jgi:hypothetical protein
LSKLTWLSLLVFLLVDLIDGCDELAVAVPPTILFAFYSPIVVLSLICGFSLPLALVLIEDCTNGLLVGGMTHYKVEQLQRRSWFAAPELMDECFVGHARDERSDHVRIHDVEKLVALLGKAVDVLT